MTDVKDLSVVQAKGWTLESAGAAYNLTLDFAPDRIMVMNYTQAGTVTKISQSYWFRGMPAGDAIQVVLVDDDGSTGDTTGALETTNGFTDAGVASGFTDQHMVIDDITDAAATLEVQTTAVHGLTTGDRVMITSVVGKTEVNNNIYRVRVTSTTKFILQTVDGTDVDGTSYTTYTSGGVATKRFADGDTVDNNQTFKITLGTSVIGANSDILYIEALKYPGGIEDLGDIA